MPTEVDKKQEEEWQAESDAHSLAVVEIIRKDPKRLKRAEAAAKKLLKQEEERAEKQQEEADALKKVAKGTLNYDVVEKQ